MDFKLKFGEVVKTTVPIVILLFVLYILLLKPDISNIFFFLVCCILVIIGFTLFLRGVDIGIMPMGVAIGSQMPKRNSILFIIGVIIVISFTITIAEPDVNVFTWMVADLYPTVNQTALVLAIATGVAVFLVIAALRILKHISLRLLLTIGYLVIIILAILTPDTFMGIAFDSGGVTTGPMTIPVLIALGLGICSVVASRSDLDSFGMVGLASIGPVITVLVYGLLVDTSTTANMASDAIIASESTINIGGSILGEMFEDTIDVFSAVLPLYAIFAIFQKFFLKYSWRDFRIMTIGILMASFGMIIFLTGIYAAFMPVSKNLGIYLINNDCNLVVLAIGIILGFLVMISEPAVNILGSQVENASQGMFSKKLITIIMAVGVSAFVGAGMYLLSLGAMSIYYILPIYGIAIILLWIMDKSLIGITYDAGGVATGPVSVAIIMTMYIGMASAKYTGPDAIINGFGIIAMIALAPIISLSILGVAIRVVKCRKQYKESS